MGCFGGSLFGRRRQSKSTTPPPAAGKRAAAAGKHSPANDWRTTAANVMPAADPVRVLGEGTFGTVVLVRERATQEFFAVKVMNKSQLVHEAQLDNIILERQVLRDAGPHPFVVECHSGFQTDEAVVLVLEYLAGGDMYDLMKANGTLTEAQARFYLAETVVGITELHRHGFVFRDLKLENILLDARGHVRLTDFGLAGRAHTDRWDDKSITDISGTSIYQAPEILSNDGHGCVVDWWALGVLAYVLLAGRPPFSNEGSRAALYQKIQRQPLDLDKDDRMHGASPECKDLITQLLQKKPAQRLGAGGGGAESVKAHPFFAAIDFDALLRFDVEPPLAPPRRGPCNVADIPKDDAMHAESQVRNKLSASHVPLNRAVAKAIRARGKHLDEGEYKPVSVTPPNGETDTGSEGRRISIGLDWSARNAEAGTKTWTGTTDDFGRKV